ncbi:MAG: hypothetical protein O7E53_02990, partial [Alphaproteobacteria bacterium]|nr:hypothetical protein [Alphaproteobacteria bacterium]
LHALGQVPNHADKPACRIMDDWANRELHGKSRAVSALAQDFPGTRANELAFTAIAILVNIAVIGRGFVFRQKDGKTSSFHFPGLISEHLAGRLAETFHGPQFIEDKNPVRGIVENGAELPFILGKQVVGDDPVGPELAQNFLHLHHRKKSPIKGARRGNQHHQGENACDKRVWKEGKSRYIE